MMVHGACVSRRSLTVESSTIVISKFPSHNSSLNCNLRLWLLLDQLDPSRENPPAHPVSRPARPPRAPRNRNIPPASPAACPAQPYNPTACASAPEQTDALRQQTSTSNHHGGPSEANSKRNRASHGRTVSSPPALFPDAPRQSKPRSFKRRPQSARHQRSPP
jgi:hypothetical protein